MPPSTFKYNPSFLSEEELVRSFVVRHDDLDFVVQIIRENDAESNQHVVVVGPRGMGKTTFVHRVAAEVARDPELSERCFPLRFAEESYQICSAGELWLEALFLLGEQTGEERWKKTHSELLLERDETRLRERALAQLLDFADEKGRRLILLVENLNMLLHEQLSTEDAWALRHTLLHEPRIMVLATATRRFAELDRQDQPMFELFLPHELRPLDTEECAAVWASVTGKEPTWERVRPIEILTGGNPRLLVILALFGAKRSFRQLMDELVHLVDEHTEYFKSHLDRLPAVERKVYLALAEIWDPAPARDVARRARLGTSKASALLRRLMDRGAVVQAHTEGRAHHYQLAERLYNVYYLMRRRGAPADRVRAVVDFMVAFYPGAKLVEVAISLVDEACALATNERRDHLATLEQIYFQCTPQTAVHIAEAVEQRLVDAEDLPEIFRARPTPDNLYGAVLNLINRSDRLAADGRHLEATETLEHVVELDPGNHLAWARLGHIEYKQLRRYDRAAVAYERLAELLPSSYLGPEMVARVALANRRPVSEIIAWLEEALDREPERADGWRFLCAARLVDDDLEGAREAVQHAIQLPYDSFRTWRYLIAMVSAFREESAELLGDIRGHLAGEVSAEALATASHAVVAERVPELEEDAYSWSVRAEAGLVGFAQVTFTTALLASRTGLHEEAIVRLPFLIADTKLVRDQLLDLIDLCVRLAIEGRAVQVLTALFDSPNMELLEPLVAGLQLATDQEIKVAPEIREIAEDIERRIRGGD